MITEIALNNFQCHKSLSISLGKITTLVGPSDSGKTTVLRALDWVCFNLGRPVLIQRRGADFVSASLTVDGHKVVRSTVNNSYHIDRQPFKTIGRNIPAEVTNLLHITEDNIQRQHDYLFWFTAKGAELVSNLNRVVDLTRLEDWIHIGVQKERLFKDEVIYCTTRKAELEHNIADVIVYRDADTELRGIEGKFAVIDEKRNKCNTITQVLNQLQDIQNKKSLYASYVSDLQDIIDETNKYSAKKQILEQIENLLNQGKQIEAGIRSRRSLPDFTVDFETYLAKQKRLIDLERTVDELEKDYAVYIPEQELENAYTTYKKQKELTDILVALVSFDREIENKTNEIEDMKREIQDKTGGICPICGKVMEDSVCG